jgi:hypothetical protein
MSRLQPRPVAVVQMTESVVYWMKVSKGGRGRPRRRRLSACLCMAAGDGGRSASISASHFLSVCYCKPMPKGLRTMKRGVRWWVEVTEDLARVSLVSAGTRVLGLAFALLLHTAGDIGSPLENHGKATEQFDLMLRYSFSLPHCMFAVYVLLQSLWSDGDVVPLSLEAHRPSSVQISRRARSDFVTSPKSHGADTNW